MKLSQLGNVPIEQRWSGQIVANEPTPNSRSVHSAATTISMHGISYVCVGFEPLSQEAVEHSVLVTRRCDRGFLRRRST